MTKANLYFADQWFFHCKLSVWMHTWQHFNTQQQPTSTNPLVTWPLCGFGQTREPQETGGKRMRSEYLFPVSCSAGSRHVHRKVSFPKWSSLTWLQVSGNHSLLCTLKGCRTLSPIVYPVHMFINGSFIKHSLDDLNSSVTSVSCWDLAWYSRNSIKTCSMNECCFLLIIALSAGKPFSHGGGKEDKGIKKNRIKLSPLSRSSIKWFYSLFCKTDIIVLPIRVC